MSWLPTLHPEGGPAPWDVVEESEGLVALLSEYWASQAGLPDVDDSGHPAHMALTFVHW